MPGPLLTDSVWSRLAPDAALLNRRDRRRVALAAVVFVGLLWLVGVGAAAGFFRPRIATNSGDTLSRPDRHEVDIGAVLHNDGLIDEKITAVRATDPNLRVRALDLPMTIRSHHTSTLVVSITVRDCTRVKNRGVTVRVTFERLWWHVSRDIALPDIRDPADGRWSVAAVCH